VVNTPIHDPSMYAGTVFADMLRANGFGLPQGVVRDRTTRQAYATASAADRRSWQVLHVFESPLMAIVNRCNKNSQNVYAESLLKRIGAAEGSPGSWANGSSAISRFLQKLGATEAEYRIDDGSGLSRENRVTANVLMRCLLNAYYSPSRQLFIDSLPTGGIDGTLRDRFEGDLRGRVFAKTGFIANVSALSGYLRTRNGEWYAFVIMMNNIPDLSNSRIKPLQERIVEAIDTNSGE